MISERNKTGDRQCRKNKISGSNLRFIDLEKLVLYLGDCFSMWHFFDAFGILRRSWCREYLPALHWNYVKRLCGGNGPRTLTGLMSKRWNLTTHESLGGLAWQGMEPFWERRVSELFCVWETMMCFWTKKLKSQKTWGKEQLQLHYPSQPINQLKKRQADSDHSTHGPSVATCYLVERSHVKEKMAPCVVKDVEHAYLWRVKTCQNAYWYRWYTHMMDSSAFHVCLLGYVSRLVRNNKKKDHPTNATSKYKFYFCAIGPAPNKQPNIQCIHMSFILEAYSNG